MKYTYLLINFFTILVPFIYSFHPKLNFHKTWKSFFPAVIITGFGFILWDMYFTHLGVWGFNEQYLTGINIGNLPLEEMLFFLCIPYACVFTFHCLSLYLPELNSSLQQKSTAVLVLIFLIAGIAGYPKLYTSVTFLSLSALLAISMWVLKTPWLGRFYIVYGILLLPFFIVNGLLTGLGLDEPVVYYNEAEMLGVRLLTIPLEDVFYGMELILINLLLYEYFKRS